MILVINTSGAGLEFVLGAQHTRVDAEKQSVALPTACEKFMHECGASWRDLTAVAVVVGPGSFTGIRLGIAYAKGLAMGLNIPVVPINAFELYLAATPDAFVAIESGRGDFFVASAKTQPQTMSIDELEYWNDYLTDKLKNKKIFFPAPLYKNEKDWYNTRANDEMRQWLNG